MRTRIQHIRGKSVRLAAVLTSGFLVLGAMTALPASAGQRVLAMAGLGNQTIKPYAQGYTVLDHQASITVPAGQVYYLNADLKIGYASTGDDMEVTPKVECSNGVKLVSGVNGLKSTVETINTRGMVTGPAVCDLKTYIRPHNSNNVSGGTVYIYGSGPTFIENLGDDWTGRMSQKELAANTLVNSYGYVMTDLYTVRPGATAVGAFFDAEVTSCYTFGDGTVGAPCQGARVSGNTSRIGYQLYVVQYNSDGGICEILGGVPETRWETVTNYRHHEDQSAYVNSLLLNDACTSRNVRAVYRSTADGNYNGFYINANPLTGGTGNQTRVTVYTN